LNLFEKGERKDNLLKAMDQVNERFGDWTLTWASLLSDKDSLSVDEEHSH
jgi:hypothetical protein